MSGHTDLDVEEVDVTVRAMLAHFPLNDWGSVRCRCGWRTALFGHDAERAHAQHAAPFVIRALEEWADLPRSTQERVSDDPWSDPKYAGAHDEPPFD